MTHPAALLVYASQRPASSGIPRARARVSCLFARTRVPRIFQRPHTKKAMIARLDVAGAMPARGAECPPRGHMPARVRADNAQCSPALGARRADAAPAARCILPASFAHSALSSLPGASCAFLCCFRHGHAPFSDLTVPFFAGDPHHLPVIMPKLPSRRSSSSRKATLQAACARWGSPLSASTPAGLRKYAHRCRMSASR